MENFLIHLKSLPTFATVYDFATIKIWAAHGCNMIGGVKQSQKNDPPPRTTKAKRAYIKKKKRIQY